MTEQPYTEAVQHLAKSFRAGVPLRVALDDTTERYGSLAWSTPAAQKALLYETILYAPALSSCNSSFSFGTTRCGRFLRLVMDEIDRVCGVDIDESFVDHAADFCQRNNFTTHHRQSYVVFDVPTSVGPAPFRSLTLRASELFNDLGHRVWEGGLFLYAQLVDTRSELHQFLRRRRVLELGAGTGLSAGAYLEAGVDYALLTDYKEDIVSNMKQNIAVNVPQNNLIAVSVLDVTNCAEASAVAKNANIDTVVATDVTYDKDLLVCMVRAFESLLVEDRIGLLVVTDRNKATTTLLKLELRAHGLAFYEMSCRPMSGKFDYLVGWEFFRVSVYRIRKESVK